MKKLFVLLLSLFLLFTFSEGQNKLEECENEINVEELLRNWDDINNLNVVAKFYENKELLSAKEHYHLTKLHYYYGKLAGDNKMKMLYYDKGVNIADEGLKIDPENVDILYYKAVCLGKYGETRGVLRSLFLVKPIRDLCNKIISIDPRHPGAHHVLGVMMRKLPKIAGGNIESSIEYLTKASQYEPEFSLHFFELAVSYIEVKNYNKAKMLLNHLKENDFPKDRVQEKQDKKEANRLLIKMVSK